MAWCNIVIISLLTFILSQSVNSRARRQLIKASSVEEIQRLSLSYPVLTVLHVRREGRGILVRRIEHILRYGDHCPGPSCQNVSPEIYTRWASW